VKFRDRSYTRQPVAEFHTLGSPPLLRAVLDAVCHAGARLAEPGEFTLRAFLAGRLDLVQAEAVLGVIDARQDAEFAAALRHDQACEDYNPDFRQLLHVGYKVAAEMGRTYTNALRRHEDIIGQNVRENIYERHIKPIFGH